MKEWIKEYKKHAIIYHHRSTLNLIAEIESLETELKLYKTPDNILVKEYQKQQEKIEELEMKIRATYDAIEEKALITIAEIKQLQAVREAAEKFVKAYYDDQPEQALKFMIAALDRTLASLVGYKGDGEMIK